MRRYAGCWTSHMRRRRGSFFSSGTSWTPWRTHCWSMRRSTSKRSCTSPNCARSQATPCCRCRWLRSSVASYPHSIGVNEMANVRLGGMRVAILLGDNFEQVEMTEPRKALDAVGARTTLISPVHGQIHGVAHDRDLQDTFPLELPLERVNPDDFDALLLPGGALNADSMRMLPSVQQFVRKFDQTGKPMG